MRALWGSSRIYKVSDSDSSGVSMQAGVVLGSSRVNGTWAPSLCQGNIVRYSGGLPSASSGMSGYMESAATSQDTELANVSPREGDSESNTIPTDVTRQVSAIADRVLALVPFSFAGRLSAGFLEVFV